jgi:small multidrug resistance family-3 protein
MELSSGLTLLVLLLAAVLEAGGDALVRLGLHSPSPLKRAELILLGGLVLMSYGVVVNLPPWDFGRLLGVYVTLFFLVAQLINWLGFGLKPTVPILVGGALIMTGGLVISFWRY